MVSNASDDFPDPDNPVTTTSLCFGISISIFFKLCARAPRTFICFAGISLTFLPIIIQFLLLVRKLNLVILSLVQIVNHVLLVSSLLPYVQLFQFVPASAVLKYLL